MAVRVEKTDRIVYILFRPDNGEPFYVGKGAPNRPWGHLKRPDKCNTFKQAVIDKCVAMGLEIPVVVLHEGLTNEKACEIEIALIAAIGRWPNGPLTNLTDGGEGCLGRVLTEEQRQNFRGKSYHKDPEFKKLHAASIKAALWEPEVVAKRLEACAKRDYSVPIDTRKRISGKLKGRPITDEARTNRKLANERPEVKSRRSDAGKRRTDHKEIGLKVSAALSGKPKSEAHCAATKAAHANPETKARHRAGLIAAWARRKAHKEAA